MSERFDCTDPEQRTEGISAASMAVRRGQLVVLPTDTVYGIGCDAFDAEAVAALLAAKGRGRDMPPPVLIPSHRTAQGLASAVPEYALTLMERFWPGPLTLVLKAQTSLHWDLGDTNGTVALRVPDHEIARELLGEIGPMAVTSANTTGDPAARTCADAQDMLGDTVAVYLDGGPAADGDASTIVDCTGEWPVTLRVGGVGQDALDAALAPPPEGQPEQQPEEEPEEGKVGEGEPESGPEAERHTGLVFGTEAEQEGVDVAVATDSPVDVDVTLDVQTPPESDEPPEPAGAEPRSADRAATTTRPTVDGPHLDDRLEDTPRPTRPPDRENPHG